MNQDATTIFTEETLAQIPVYYRFITETETKNIQENRIGARYSLSERYFSNSLLNFPCYKPVEDEDVMSYISKSGL
jgi:hypothetical protein